MMTTVKHRRIDLDGMEIFFREAGQQDAPAILLPHGYPCSSYEFRNFMPALADRWRLIAPDFPGCGYSDTPDGFAYDLLQALCIFPTARKPPLRTGQAEKHFGCVMIHNPRLDQRLVLDFGDAMKPPFGVCEREAVRVRLPLSAIS